MNTRALNISLMKRMLPRTGLSLPTRPIVRDMQRVIAAVANYRPLAEPRGKDSIEARRNALKKRNG